MYIQWLTGKHFTRKDWRWKRTKRTTRHHLSGEYITWYGAEWNCSKRRQRLKRQAAKTFRKHDKEVAYNGNLSRRVFHLSWKLW